MRMHTLWVLDEYKLKFHMLQRKADIREKTPGDKSYINLLLCKQHYSWIADKHFKLKWKHPHPLGLAHSNAHTNKNTINYLSL